jgi:spore coat polysaccharide biosynthesis protein SpsF
MSRRDAHPIALPDQAQVKSIPAIVQARMGSLRLPGKMLRQVHGKPILQYVIERLRHCPVVADIVVATSIAPADAAIAELCEQVDVRCVRGAIDDVAGRFRQVVDACGFDCFVRICGDRPLLDVDLVTRGAALYDGDIDVVTNVQPPTFPAGQTVEIVRASAFAEACTRMQDPQDREHVTRHFYRHPSDYRIVNFAADAHFDGVHLAIDTAADLERFESIVGRMDRPHWSYRLSEVVAMYREAA